MKKQLLIFLSISLAGQSLAVLATPKPAATQPGFFNRPIKEQPTNDLELILRCKCPEHKENQTIKNQIKRHPMRFALFMASLAGICGIAVYAAYKEGRASNPTGFGREYSFAPDEAPARHNNLAMAPEPHPDNQIHIAELPRLEGFYHMRSNTPYREVPGSCGIQALYTIENITAQVFARPSRGQEFIETQEAIMPIRLHKGRYGLGGYGLDDRIALIERLGLEQPLHFFSALDSSTNDIKPAILADDVNRTVQAFRNTNGARIANFLCGIPEHVFLISVIRWADATHGMYLHDNLNEQPDHINLMRRYIAYIYNRFF